MLKKQRGIIYGLLFTVVSFYGCATISQFDQYAYTQSTSIKVDVLNLMDKATDPYANHLADINDVNSKLMKNIEYEKHRPKNEITITMYNIIWKLVNDSTTIHIAGSDFKHGFLPQWQKKTQLSSAFIEQAKKQLGDGFDMIAELESKKIKPADSGVQSFLSANK